MNKIKENLIVMIVGFLFSLITSVVGYFVATNDNDKKDMSVDLKQKADITYVKEQDSLLRSSIDKKADKSDLETTKVLIIELNNNLKEMIKLSKQAGVPVYSNQEASYSKSYSN